MRLIMDWKWGWYYGADNEVNIDNQFIFITKHIYPYLIIMNNNGADDKADDEDVEYDEEEEDSR